MEKWKELEFEYAKRLRESSAEERRHLYAEAYTVISKMAIQRKASADPEARTAGTSKLLVHLLSQVVSRQDHVLEIGCGRGYTCLKLAPNIKSMVGLEVSDSSVLEAKKTLAQNKINNVTIQQVSAFELTDHFRQREFDVALSIDVVEHLHPEDAKEHFRQVFEVLKPGGKYILIMPNRLSGPHDITRDEFPDAKEALGFHLNESTYKELKAEMKEIGYNRFQALYKNILVRKAILPMILPAQVSIISEMLYKNLPASLRKGLLTKLISIKLIAYKPK